MTESAPTAPGDLGLFVGRWFQGLACLFVGFMVLAPLLLDKQHYNGAFLFFFWVAPYLKRHRPRARWVAVGLCVVVLVGTWLATMPLHLAFKLGLTAVVAVPLVLLLSPRARAEFAPPGE